MKIRLFPGLAILSALSSASADWVIEQKSTVAGKEQTTTMHLTDRKLRIDQGDEMSMILNSEDGGVTMIMHGQKSIMQLDAEKLKGMNAIAGAVASGAGKAAQKPIATGQKEKVGEYDCEIYTWTGKMGSGKFWIARDFKGFEKINEASDKLMQAMGNPMAALVPQAKDFPGMAVKSEMQIMGQSATTELVSAREGPVDAGVFALPDSYKEMQMPAIPGIPGK